MGAACCVASRPREYNSELSTLPGTGETNWTDKLQTDAGASPGNCVPFQRTLSLNSRGSRVANSWDSTYQTRDHSTSHSVESSPLSTNVCESQWLNSPANADNDGKSITTASELALSPCLTEGSSKEGCSTVDPYVQMGTPESLDSSVNTADCSTKHNKCQFDSQHISHGQKSSWRQPPMRSRSFFFRRSHHAYGNNLSRQISDSRIYALNGNGDCADDQRSSFKVTAGSSNGAGIPHGVSDWWSMQTFTDLVASSRRENFPGFDANCLDFGWNYGRESVERASLATERIRVNNLQATPVLSSTESQTCGICSKMLSYNLCVVAVLVCGHVYHAECLEQTTPEAHQHDPLCPLCNAREEKQSKQQPSPLEHVVRWKGATFKAFRSQSQSSVRNKGSRNGVAADDLSDPHFFSGEILLSSNGRASSLTNRNEKDRLSKSIFRRHFSLRGKSKEEHPASYPDYRLPIGPSENGIQNCLSPPHSSKKGIFRLF